MAERRAQPWAPWRSSQVGFGRDWVPGRKTRPQYICKFVSGRCMSRRYALRASRQLASLPRCYLVTMIFANNCIAARRVQARLRSDHTSCLLFSTIRRPRCPKSFLLPRSFSTLSPPQSPSLHPQPPRQAFSSNCNMRPLLRFTLH